MINNYLMLINITYKFSYYISKSETGTIDKERLMNNVLHSINEKRWQIYIIIA